MNLIDFQKCPWYARFPWCWVASSFCCVLGWTLMPLQPCFWMNPVTRGAITSLLPANSAFISRDSDHQWSWSSSLKHPYPRYTMQCVCQKGQAVGCCTWNIMEHHGTRATMLVYHGILTAKCTDSQWHVNDMSMTTMEAFDTASSLISIPWKVIMVTIMWVENDV